jgi:hypothetical protein
VNSLLWCGLSLRCSALRAVGFSALRSCESLRLDVRFPRRHFRGSRKPEAGSRKPVTFGFILRVRRLGVRPSGPLVSQPCPAASHFSLLAHARAGARANSAAGPKGEAHGCPESRKVTQRKSTLRRRPAGSLRVRGLFDRTSCPGEKDRASCPAPCGFFHPPSAAPEGTVEEPELKPRCASALGGARSALDCRCSALALAPLWLWLWLLLRFGRCSALALAPLWLLLRFGSCRCS